LRDFATQNNVSVDSSQDITLLFAALRLHVDLPKFFLRPVDHDA
jgi:hypothetical protein